MKNLSFLIIITIFCSSCSTYQAGVKRHDNLEYGAIKVQPEWKYKEPKAKKLILPVISIAGAAAYGYSTETK